MKAIQTLLVYQYIVYQAIEYYSNGVSMKQSIRPTRATLYFQFIALRDLTPVRAGATP